MKWLVFILFLSSCSYYVIDNRIETSVKKSPAVLANYQFLIVNRPAQTDGYNIPGALEASITADANYSALRSLGENKESTIANTAIAVAELTYSRYWEQNIFSDEIGGIILPVPPAESGDDTTINLELDRSSAELESRNIALVDPALPVLINARVIVRLSIYGLDNKLINTKEQLVTFQQYYNGIVDYENRPDGQVELTRLIRLGLDRLIYDLNYSKINEYQYFERGRTSNPLRSAAPNLEGQITIDKGIRFAHSAKWAYAITAWQKASFEPESATDPNFIQNRASAYYNIAQVYSINGIWSEATKFYAYANLTLRKTHYAQAWADATVRWLNEKEKGPTAVSADLIRIADGIKAPQDIDFLIPKPNMNLLLDKEVLWPGEVFKE